MQIEGLSHLLGCGALILARW